MIITRKKNICIAVVLATVLIPVPLQAGDVEWVTDADGFWHESGNWSSDPLLPGSGDDVTIDRAGSDITVTHSQDATSIGNLLCTEDLTVTGGSITVSGAGHISGAITIQNSASFKADGADLLAGGATTLDGGKLYAIGGGVLSLPDAGAYVNPSTDAWSHGWLKADGADSALDLSNIASLAGSTGSFSVLNIQGLNGGYVDLSSVSAYNTGGVQVLAEGSGGVVDLSTLTSMTPGPVFGVTNSITARNGGVVLMGNLAVLDGVNLDIDGTGTMATAQIANYTNGIVTLSGAAPDFSGLANVAGSRFNANGVHLDLNHMTDVHEITIELQNGATADLGGATNIDGASFIVAGGTTLSIPAATNRGDSRTDGWSHGWLTADGAGSVLNLSNITGLAGSLGSFSVLHIEGVDGGLVDLRAVGAYTTGGVQILADGADSVVDLSGLTSLATGAVFGVTNSITARNGGTVRLHPGQTVVADADVVMETGGTIEVGALVLGFGGKLSGNGQVNAKITGQAGSSIVADQGDMTLGDGGADDGFFSDGSLLTGANRVTINDRNEAVLGLLTEVGDGVAAGAIVAGIADPSDAHAHFLLEQGKEMVGRGLIIGHYKNHGRVIGDGTALSERIIFEREWTVTGRGSFEYVGFKGRFAPGDSPTIVSTTHAWYSGATVQIELGGLTPGSVDDNHDQINDTATVWLDLDEAPVLEILPWNGFVPEIGDEFVILTWKGGLDGVFGDVIVDPWFTARGLDFDLQYHNVDGAGDLTIEAIPEPATLSLIALGGLVVLRRRHRC